MTELRAEQSALGMNRIGEPSEAVARAILENNAMAICAAIT